jgi:carbonic anhydrase
MALTIHLNCQCSSWSWYLTTEQHVTAATIARFKGLFTAGNARATQPLNGRTFVEVPRI